MDGADARAGEHGHRSFGNHRHIDSDAVAFLDAARLQHVGKTADLGVQLLVSEFLVVLRIVAFPENGGLVTAFGQVTVDAVVADVECAVLEPLDGNVVRIVRGVLHLGEGLDPVDALGLLGPEAVRVLDRTVVHLLVLGVVDEGALPPFSRHVIDLIGHRHFLPPAVDAAGSRYIICWFALCDGALICDKADKLPLWSQIQAGFSVL